MFGVIQNFIWISPQIILFYISPGQQKTDIFQHSFQSFKSNLNKRIVLNAISLTTDNKMNLGSWDLEVEI